VTNGEQRRPGNDGADDARSTATDRRQASRVEGASADERDDRDDPAGTRDRHEDEQADPATGTADGDTGTDPSDWTNEDDPESDWTEGGDDVFTAERQWRETRRIPALDPDESMDPDAPLGGVERDGAGTHGNATRVSTEETTTEYGPAEAPDGRESEPTETDSEEGDVDPGAASPAATETGAESTPDELAAELRSLRETHAATEAERDELAARVDELESNLESVRRERDEQRERIADLETELDRLREAADPAEDGGGNTGTSATTLAPAAARAGTNLFVRYRSKGEPTLDDARAGEAEQDAVVGNLRVEYHTTFDESTTVDGEPYETFLHGTTEWNFVQWVVEELLYEIGRSGHRTDLAPLFDRIPEIDRVQFDGEVAVTVESDDGDSHESRTFDLVFRDSMGDPLFVADVDSGRNATSAEMVGSLVEGARAVGTSKDTLGGAFYVTTSFFDPEALDAVSEETSGGLLSRSAKKSYVKLSRKRGYHLCLVEARENEFHLSVPEL
jgi:hypothetical protein